MGYDVVLCLGRIGELWFDDVVINLFVFYLEYFRGVHGGCCYILLLRWWYGNVVFFFELSFLLFGSLMLFGVCGLFVWWVYFGKLIW